MVASPAGPGSRRWHIGQHFTFARCLLVNLLLWVALTIFPLYSLEKADFLSSSADDPLANYAPIAIALMLMIDAVYFRKFLSSFAAAITGSLAFAWLISAFLTISISAALTGEKNALVYAIVTMVILANLRMFWLESRLERERFWILGAVLISLYVCGAIYLKGMPIYRWIGGIHPNLMGGASLALFFFCTMSRSRWRVPFAMVACWAAYIVNSRFALVGMTLIVSALWIHAIVVPRYGAVWRILLLLLLFLAAVSASAHFEIIARTMEIDSIDRGMNSGFTGREESAERFLPQLLEHWAFGFGYRQRDNYIGVHNGYLNFLLETGIFSSAIVFSYMVMMLLRLVIGGLSTQYAASDEEGRLGASLLAFAVAIYFQPQMINFGDPMGISIMLIVSYPFPRVSQHGPISHGKLCVSL